MKQFFSALTFLAFGLIAGGAAHAADGTINSVSFGKIPPGSTVAVKPWDNSGDNMRVAKEIENTLKNNGYKISSTARLVLSFETKDIIGRWQAGERRHLVEVQGSGGRNGGEKASAKLNLYSTKKGGVFNEGEAPENVVPSKYVLDMTLDQKNGPRLWEGQATASLRRTDSFELVKSMVPIIIEHFGKTVRQKPFDLK